MKVSIIGGSGFIGTRLCHRLNQFDDFKCSIIDKVPSLSFPNLVKLGDVRSLDALRQAISDGSVIVNLAAEHRDDVRPLSLYNQVNVQGAQNICTVANEKNINTIVFTSTVAVYGFAPIGTDESGAIAPFNEYGRTKYEAEQVFMNWQAKDPSARTLVLLRPTVVFGEQNRGNVYTLLRQIASGRFLMVGDGENIKSLAYVENIAAFIQHSLNFKPGVHIYNYADKPDFTMNNLVDAANRILGKSSMIAFRLPYLLGMLIGKVFDVAALITGKRFIVSSIRVKKFCANTMYETSISKVGFIAPVPLSEALERTIRYEFLESHQQAEVFYTE